MPPDATPRQYESLRTEVSRLVVRGLAWKTVSQVWSQVTRTFVTIVLARLLGPLDFGIAGMVLVLSALVVPLSDLGLGAALVQRKTITATDCSTVFWASTLIGALFTLIGFAVAPLVARFYHEPEVTSLFAVLSLSFFVTGIGATQRSLLGRAMDFRSLEIRLMVGGLAGGVIGIALAAAGAGPWALVGLALTQAVVSTVLLWVFSPWRPSAAFSLASLRRLGPFGARSVGAGIFTALSQNADNMLIGRYLGATPLGLYTLAYSVILVPLSRITGPLQQVFAPAFSRLQEDLSGIASTWIRSTRLIAAASIPLMLGIAVTAPDAVPALFGEGWSGAVPVVQILACVSFLQTLQALDPAILFGLDRMRTYLRFTALSFAVVLASFVLGLRWGIVGVAACFAVANLALAVVLNALVAKTLSMSPVRILASLRGLWQPTVAMLAATIIVRQVASAGGIGPWGRIVLVGVAGLIAYVGVGRWSAPDLAREAWELRRRWQARPTTTGVG